MAIRHSNPTRPRKDRKTQTLHWARAPYNFVPLPERLVFARQPLPDHDSYHEDGESCWIECELETCSPTYVRGMLTEEQHKAQGRKKPDELTDADKKERAPFFSTWEEEIKEYGAPLIPGSTLRGMVRALVEVVGHGRLRWVAKEPTFTFRAVAASRDDPLRDPYREVIGSFGRNVRAGYLEKEGDDWYVRPAMTPAEKGWPGRDAYIKVKERQIGSKDIPGYLRFNSPRYRPQLHKVSFNVTLHRGGRGGYVWVSQIGPREANFQYQGVLVCSGNMMETGKPGQRSPRRNHALVLEPNAKARRLKINRQAVKDYIAGMTPFQRDELKEWGGGQPRLKAGNPVFYVPEGNQVFYFGHSPNFRIPARLHGAARAATPRDFVPEPLYADAHPDLADAIFGWVEEREDIGGRKRVVGPENQRAGRVFFEDAHFVGASEDGVWFKDEPITPHVLSGPKPTTFQHYLAQDAKAGHNPDRKDSLAHYGTPRDETQVRGHKLYWHKGAAPDIEATAAEREHKKQLTRIVPLKPGVRFRFRIHFENLREEELGVLLWVLTLPGEEGTEYRHRLGMGKPFGMGAVKIIPHLHITDRQARYRGLFKGNAWGEATTAAEVGEYVEVFERYVLDRIGSTCASLREVDRIQEFLAMMAWRKDDSKWLDATRYMEIERGLDKINEYKERPVLPTPRGVLDWFAGEPVEQIAPVRPREIRRGGLPSDAPEQAGEVKVFGLGKTKSFGFIKPDDGGPDIFVHRNQLRGLQTLERGQRVVFRIGKGMKGPEAKDVRLED